MAEDVYDTQLKRQMEGLISKWAHLDVEKNQLYVTPSDSVGFFGNCTMTLWALTSSYPRKSFVRVNWSAQHSWRDSNQAGMNLFDLYFDQNSKADMLQLSQVPPIHYHSTFLDLPFQKLSPYVEHYFAPSKIVLERQRELVNKYDIDYDKIVAIYYRGTDKWSEITPIPLRYYILEAQRLMARDQELRVLIQTDQEQIKEECFDYLGNKAFCFEELPVTSSLTGVHHISAEVRGLSNFQFGTSLLAVANILSKCRYIITSTNNFGLWVMLYRGTAKNTAQLKPRAPALISNYLERLEPSNLERIPEEPYELRFEIAKLSSELKTIKNSFGYRFMKFYAAGVHQLFPDGTRRGKLRETVINRLQAVPNNKERR